MVVKIQKSFFSCLQIVLSDNRLFDNKYLNLTEVNIRVVANIQCSCFALYFCIASYQ
jgi:hypothetical protein